MEFGLLDLSVELSTRDITAGNEFALFVLVKNPYNKSVWIHDVNVSLPSDLKLANADSIKKEAEKAESKFYESLEKTKIERSKLTREIENLLKVTQSLENSIQGKSDNQLYQELRSTNSEIEDLIEKLNKIDAGMSQVYINGADIHTIKIGSESTKLHIDGNKESPTTIRNLEVYAPWLIHEEQTKGKIVRLESSLPNNSSLQPGSTAVYTAVLNIKKPIVFTPSQYRLQFYVNFGFKNINQSSQKPVDENSLDGIHTNTISHSLSIRPSVYSVLAGAVLGGFAGALARVMQLRSSLTVEESIISFILSAILSAIAVIFMVRKSDTQSFVSIEDFWGGLLIGFLVGYTGTSFFENLTKVALPK